MTLKINDYFTRFGGKKVSQLLLITWMDIIVHTLAKKLQLDNITQAVIRNVPEDREKKIPRVFLPPI